MAQKLPSLQPNGLRIPSATKIDGKATEWNNQFQAYNKAVDLYYTIANDDENLYLILRATKPRIIQKCMYVGITFTINKSEKKDRNSPSVVSIAYPILNAQDVGKIIFNANANEFIPGTVSTRTTDSLTNSKISVEKLDSTIKIANRLIVNSANLIKIKGIAQITDTLISVYNEDKIRVAASFDNKGTYTYELSIPLKYIGVPIQSFNYNIKLKSRWEEPKKGMPVRFYYPVRGGGAVDADADLDSTTDFWGKYTLEKK